MPELLVTRNYYGTSGADSKASAGALKYKVISPGRNRANSLARRHIVLRIVRFSWFQHGTARTACQRADALRSDACPDWCHSLLLAETKTKTYWKSGGGLQPSSNGLHPSSDDEHAFKGFL